MRILTAADVQRALSMAEAIQAMKDLFAAFHLGRARAPLRTVLTFPDRGGVTLVMPGVVEDGANRALTVKVASLFDGNRDRGLPLLNAAVVVLNPDTGQVQAIVEGGSLTALRTGALCGAATDLLARPESATLALFGSSVQARTQLQAICTVRPIQNVRVYSPTPGHAQAFAREMAGQGPVPHRVQAVTSPAAALDGADIICAATTSAVPIFADADVPPGAHINAVGSYKPHVQELPGETVVRSLLVVDNREAALEETGDLIQPIAQGLFGPEHIHGDLGELVLGKILGRTSRQQITLFKSVGMAIQDAAAARIVLAEADRLGLGQEVAWP